MSRSSETDFLKLIFGFVVFIGFWDLWFFGVSGDFGLWFCWI